ncbi:putative quinol monooxygenase, partial [Pseudomonas sp. FW305-E2]
GDSVEGWLVYEDWHSSEAFDGHLQTPYVQAFMTELDTFCSEVPKVHTFERRA